MKKTLLLTSALVALGMNAQVAKLQDVTPAGYDFSKYEDGAQFKVHASPTGNFWSPDPGIFDLNAYKNDGQFTVFMYPNGPGSEASNTAEKIAADNQGICVRDFGGYLGKCLVLNQQYAPLATATENFKKNFGETPWPAVKQNPGKQMLCFYISKDDFQHPWPGKAIRVRLVLNVMRRGCHALSGDKGIDNTHAFSEVLAEDNGGIAGGWYRPSDEWQNNNYTPESTVPILGSEFAKWVDEGTTVAEMPANPQILAPTEKASDPWDNTGHACAGAPMYYMQLDRFMVYEWDVYTNGENEHLKVWLNIPAGNTSVIIKEIKFFNITNARDLLEIDDEGNVLAYKEGSYINKRVKSWRYYTEAGVKEFEGGAGTGDDEQDGTEAHPFLINTAEELEAIKGYMDNATTPVYYKLMADIDMAGINHVPFVGSTNSGFGKELHFDGNNHIISNLTSVITDTDNPEFYYASLCGVLTGSVKNLGLVDVNLKSSLGVGAVGGYGAYGTAGTIDNVYVTGNIENPSAYAGGICGTNNADLTISNCYSQATVKGKTFAGGLVGRGRENITVQNSYTAGTITATDGTACQIAATDKANTAKLKLESVATVATAADGISNYGTTVSGSCDTDLNKVATWAAFNEGKTFNDMPALNWQENAWAAGVDAIDADDNAPVEYYNLQGIRVENPSNGLYIRRQGNKATKVIL